MDLVELVDLKFPKESFANLVAVLHTGNLNAAPYAPIAPGDQEQAKAATEKKKKNKKKKAKKVDLPSSEGAAGGVAGNVTSESDSESESPSKGDIPNVKTARANRVYLASDNKAVVKSALSKKLSTMTTEEVQEVFRGLRAMKEDSPMTDTVV